MAYTGGDILVDALVDWDVEYVFGIPGDGIKRDHGSLAHET